MEKCAKQKVPKVYTTRLPPPHRAVGISASLIWQTGNRHCRHATELNVFHEWNRPLVRGAIGSIFSRFKTNVAARELSSECARAPKTARSHFLMLDQDDCPTNDFRPRASFRRLTAPLVFREIRAIDTGLNKIPSFKRTPISASAVLACLDPGWLVAPHPRHGEQCLSVLFVVGLFGPTQALLRVRLIIVGGRHRPLAPPQVLRQFNADYLLWFHDQWPVKPEHSWRTALVLGIKMELGGKGTRGGEIYL